MTTKLVIIEQCHFKCHSDYNLQQKAAFEKYVNMHGVGMNLNRLEQQLVHEQIDVSYFYPEWKHVIVVSPYQKK